MNLKCLAKRILLGFAFASGIFPFNKPNHADLPGHGTFRLYDDHLPYLFIDTCAFITEASLREACPSSNKEMA